MKRQHYTNIAVTTICLVVSALALANTDLKRVVSFTKSAIPSIKQDLEREVQKERSHPKDPLDLTEIKVQGKVLRIREKFLEDGDWLKKVTFKLRNKYSKTITFIQVNIDFPETESSGIMIQKQLLLGRHPVYGKPTSPPPLNLMSGESLEVSLAMEFESIKKMIERRHSPIGSISKILIRLSDVGFEDGTIYAAGEFYKRNPDANSSSKWLKIEQ
jgi:hypothetical protein